MSTIASIIAAIFKAIPALKDIFSLALDIANAANAAEAASRKQEKDKAVDAAIDGESEIEDD